MNRKLLKNNKGIAILMTITTITLLTWLLATFTFDTQLNQKKLYTYQDKEQAKLTAQAGLTYALGLLNIYQEARNKIEKNKDAKQFVTPADLEKALISLPFAYPIPVKNPNAIQKSALQEFEKNTFLKGQLLVTISPITGFLNPNNLRILPKKPEEDTQNNQSNNSDDSEEEKPIHVYIEKKFNELITNIIREKSENDEEFEKSFGDLEVPTLVNELKYFVNNPNVLDDSIKSDIESLYLDNDVRPKHAPLTSLSELYQLQGWPEGIINLVKNKLTVHQAQTIVINKIDKDQLKLIFPKISEEQVEEFFKYRDGDPELDQSPNPFKSIGEFKSVITGNLAVLSEEDYEERVKELEKADLKLGLAGKLFKVESQASYRDINFKITAFVDLPVKPVFKSTKTNNNKNNSNNNSNNTNASTNQNTQNNNSNKKNDDKATTELLPPRVVELQIST